MEMKREGEKSIRCALLSLAIYKLYAYLYPPPSPSHSHSIDPLCALPHSPLNGIAPPRIRHINIFNSISVDPFRFYFDFPHVIFVRACTLLTSAYFSSRPLYSAPPEPSSLFFLSLHAFRSCLPLLFSLIITSPLCTFDHHFTALGDRPFACASTFTIVLPPL